MTISRVTRADGTSRWRVRVKSGRKVVADRTFDRKSDASKWEQMQKRALDLGEFVDPRAGKEQLGSVLERWLPEREGTVGEKTFREAERPALAYLKHLAKKPISSITSRDLETVYATNLQKLARTTVQRQRQTYSVFFTWAVSNKLISANPATGSKVPRGTATKEKREIFPFTLAELRAVHADMARSTRKENADLVLVLGLTGLRWGELAALRVRDVQQLPYPAFRVTLSRSDRQQVRNVTKGGKARVVPLADEVANIVLPLIDGKRPDALVFPNTNGNHRSGRNWSRDSHWETSNRGRRVHDLRHTAATLWLQNGVDLKTVQAWLGHSTAKLTADLYAHYMGSDADTAALAKMNAVLGDAGGTVEQNRRKRGAS
jgi:integrase